MAFIKRFSFFNIKDVAFDHAIIRYNNGIWDLSNILSFYNYFLFKCKNKDNRKIQLHYILNFLVFKSLFA